MEQLAREVPGYVGIESVRDGSGFGITVSYWESEQLRLEWVARPVHDQVFEPNMELAESISSTVKTVGHTWNI